MSEGSRSTQRDREQVHRALLYGSDEEFLSSTVPFMAEGQRDGDAMLAVTTRHNAGLLRERLPRGGDGVEFVDSTAGWFGTTPSRLLVFYDDYVREHERLGRWVRVVGEPVWRGRGVLERRAWQRYESLFNLAFAGRRVSWVCPYDVRILDSDVLDAARRSHPQLSGAAGETPSPDYIDPATFCAEYGAEPLPEPVGTVAELAFSADEVPAAREFASRNARQAALPPARVADVVLAVNEVVTNAVRHGGGRGRLRAWRDEHSLVFEVDDDGEGRPDPLAGQLRPSVEGRHEPGGRGLWAARQLSDLLEIRHGPGWLVRLYTNLR